jgi:hypothetical protein
MDGALNLTTLVMVVQKSRCRVAECRSKVRRWCDMMCLRFVSLCCLSSLLTLGPLAQIRSAISGLRHTLANVARTSSAKKKHDLRTAFETGLTLDWCWCRVSGVAGGRHARFSI